VVVLIVVKLASGPGGGMLIPTTAAVSENDWIKGSLDASVTLIEYSDFQCPACKTYDPFVQRLTDEFGDELLFVYRHLPLHQIHPNAEAAAWAAEAAGQQGVFWEMHGILFERQSEWEDARNPEDLFVVYAETLGLDVEQFRADMKSDAVQDKVRADENSAIQARIQSTPTFFLNGEQIQISSRYEDLKQLIIDAGATPAISAPTFQVKSAETE
jgi:protein-disulfide isomerase